ncbi:hypothetical protein Aconfl_01680 [Algoriphagus confluentis]|uniref:Uncharacterized protein n=1 Tax=Algoriphagus confluentis TaxID=1697556 RepID=A0ABQ6PIV7_9BACT|nr:hypothetical protein Aconfl_01680 [Algoriphagus confluentis]
MSQIDQFSSLDKNAELVDLPHGLPWRFAKSTFPPKKELQTIENLHLFFFGKPVLGSLTTGKDSVSFLQNSLAISETFESAPDQLILHSNTIDSDLLSHQPTDIQSPNPFEKRLNRMKHALPSTKDHFHQTKKLLLL